MPPRMGAQCHDLLAGTTLAAMPGAAQEKQLEGPANWPCAMSSGRTVRTVMHGRVAAAHAGKAVPWGPDARCRYSFGTQT